MTTTSDATTIRAGLPVVRTTGTPGRPAANLRPVWRVTVKGQDISARIAPRLVVLTQ